jgi:drug/metabolite transporter (DMT)-like permease
VTSSPTAPPAPSTSTERDWSLAAMGVTVLLWASAFVGIRAVADVFEPGPLSLGRLLVGALALVVLARPWRHRLPRGRTLALVVVYGVLWFGAYNVALNAGETYLDAGTAALVVNIGPILIALLAGIVLKEGFPRPLVVGQVGSASAGDVAWLVYLGVFPTAIGFTTWSYALRRLSAGQVASTTYLVPAVATLISWVLLGEVPAPLAFVGGALCLLGVAITRLRRRGAATS